MPQIRPEGLCFRATLKSGRATANPITWPFRSAKHTRSGTTIGLSCFARWSISALVRGTNPQFRSHAWLYSALTSSTSSLKRFMLSGRRVIPLRCAMTFTARVMRSGGGAVRARERDQILGFGETVALMQGHVVRGVVRHHDGGRGIEPVDQQPTIVVDRRVHRSAHHPEVLPREPPGGRVEQGIRHRLLVHALEEAIESHPIAMLAVMGVVLDGRDAADWAAVPDGEEILRFGVLEEGILARREEGPDVHPQLRHPQWVAAVQVVRKADEPLQTAPVGHGHDLRSAQMTPSSFPSLPKVSRA